MDDHPAAPLVAVDGRPTNGPTEKPANGVGDRSANRAGGNRRTGERSAGERTGGNRAAGNRREPGSVAGVGTGGRPRGWNQRSPDRSPAHRPRRPGWECQACGREWPCRQGKTDLLAQYADDRVGLLVYLAGLLVDAVQDIPVPPDTLLDRFLRWAKIGESS